MWSLGGGSQILTSVSCQFSADNDWTFCFCDSRYSFNTLLCNCFSWLLPLPCLIYLSFAPQLIKYPRIFNSPCWLSSSHVNIMVIHYINGYKRPFISICLTAMNLLSIDKKLFVLSISVHLTILLTQPFLLLPKSATLLFALILFLLKNSPLL